MRAELVGLNGGRKQLWLRQHRGEVESFYGKHGAEATLAEFNIRQETLMRFFDRKSKDVRLNKLSQADRWVYRMCMDGQRELQKQVNELKDWVQEANPIIEVGRAIINATSEHARLKVASPALFTDPLQLANLVEKSGK